MAGNFSVKEAVWIAATVHAYFAFKNGKKDISDYCLSASDLQKSAQFYTESKVQNARIYQHYNGDHSNHTERYLRRMRIDENLCYRVTAPGEFGGNKEHPDFFYFQKNRDISLRTELGVDVSVKELIDFLAGEYMSIINNADQWWPSLDDYNPDISYEKWIEILNDKDTISSEKLSMLRKMVKLGGVATCTKLAEKFGGDAISYKNSGQDIGRLINHNYGVPFFKDGDTNRMFTIPFVGRNVTEDGKSRYAWKIREPLMRALKEIDFGEDIEMNKSKNFDLNTILYGPPGTGKTYNTVNYAVAIIEGKSLEGVKSEDYEVVKERYEQYKDAGQIAFTTFHQSYGYEEFIEGIKPNINDENEDGLEYTIESGIFKSFCEKALVALSMDDTTYGINKSPTVWKVSLEGTGDNPTRRECLENNHIRIGWDSYGKDIVDDQDFDNGGRRELNAFINKMRIGDIVFSCYSASTIDAIGVITGDYEWHDEYNRYKRVRSVKWLVKNINEYITDLNGGANMKQSSVYQLKVTTADALKLVEKNTQIKKSTNQQKNFVFIIDEINRGNISKIFGELITLIENTKRIGAK